MKISASLKSLRIKLRRLFWPALVLLVLFAVYEAVTWPDVGALEKQNPKTTAFIERYKKLMIKKGKKPAVYWQWTPLSSISPNLRRAVLVSEDLNFYNHHGFDFRELYYALQEAWEEGELTRGASTITQQTAKNLWLSPSRNPFRKFKEAVLTLQLEYHLRKYRILEIYLNVAEFGPGVYGARAASQYYFKVAPAQLTEEQAAMLAASLPKPKLWHPGSESKAYARRVGIIQSRMQKHSYL
jgi:monofunctional glycosyltransferase